MGAAGGSLTVDSGSAASLGDSATGGAVVAGVSAAARSETRRCDSAGTVAWCAGTSTVSPAGTISQCIASTSLLLPGGVHIFVEVQDKVMALWHVEFKDVLAGSHIGHRDAACLAGVGPGHRRRGRQANDFGWWGSGQGWSWTLALGPVWPFVVW